MAEPLEVTLEFTGGAELLFGGVRKHVAQLPPQDQPCMSGHHAGRVDGHSMWIGSWVPDVDGRFFRTEPKTLWLGLDIGYTSRWQGCSSWLTNFLLLHLLGIDLILEIHCMRTMAASAHRITNQDPCFPILTLRPLKGTMRQLLPWIRDNLLKERPELFIYEGGM